MAGGITAAVIGGGAILGGAYLSSQASKSAAQTQADAANNATASQRAALEQQIKLSQPYRAAGTAAQNKLMQYLGITPAAGETTGVGAPSGIPEKTVENFDSAAYLAANPDVAAQIGRPGVESAWAHYQNYGQNEGRQFTAIPSVAAAATAAAEEYKNSPDFGKYASAQFGGIPGFNPASLMQDFGGVQGFDPASLLRNFSESDFKQDPGYAFRLKEGLNAMNASAAARGGLISGNALKAGQQYGQEMGSQEYQNAFNRYQANRAVQGQEYTNAFNRFGANRAFQAGEYGNAFNRFQTERANTLSPLQTLSGQGQAAAAGQAANIGNFGAQQASNTIGAANAQAAGQVGAANAYANAINQGVGMYQTNQLLNRFAPQPTNTSAYGGIGSFFNTNNTASPFYNTGANALSPSYMGGTSSGE